MMWVNYRKAFIICATFLLLVGCSSEQGEVERTVFNHVDNLAFTIFKIGKADSMLLTVGDQHVLIDTGEDEDGEEVLDYLTKNKIDTIDYMILTHFDKDHVGGADIILNGSKVLQVITPNHSKNSNQYKEYTAALSVNNLSATILKEKLSFSLGSVEFTVYPPQKEGYKEDNDYSLVVSVAHGNNSFLFAGDAEEERLTELIAQGNLKHTFLKVPHHGRYEKNSTEFFKRVYPQYAVITSSDKNPEENEVMEALQSIGTEVFLTRNGDISVSSDGNTIEIKQ